MKETAEVVPVGKHSHAVISPFWLREEAGVPEKTLEVILRLAEVQPVYNNGRDERHD